MLKHTGHAGRIRCNVL